MISAKLPRRQLVAAVCVGLVAVACRPRTATFVPPSAAFLDLAVIQRPSSTASVQVSRYETPSTLNVESVEFPTTEVAIQRGRLEYSGGVLELQLFFAGDEYAKVESWLTDPSALPREKMILAGMALLADGTCVLDHSPVHQNLTIRTEASVGTYKKLVGMWGAE
ncbi:MAG: hypothetical protein NTV21_02850 [Planctomycetota bacterium]|nr:hypothetical protein [Planctomycetota bacterium]